LTRRPSFYLGLGVEDVDKAGKSDQHHK